MDSQRNKKTLVEKRKERKIKDNLQFETTYLYKRKRH